jgi:hypothetical protein
LLDKLLLLLLLLSRCQRSRRPSCLLLLLQLHCCSQPVYAKPHTPLDIHGA